MKVQEAITAVETSIGSMYTREDVISLLKKLEAPVVTGNVNVSDLISKVSATIKDAARNLDNDVIDKSSAEFSLNYNEIELDSVDLDHGEIATQIQTDVEEVINDFFENLANED